MFTREEDVEAHALRSRGWSISAIARHLGRDRKTIRAHLERRREPGIRARRDDDFARFEPYVAQRFADDAHLRTTVLARELRSLGFTASYQTLTREIRSRGLRPRCDACSSQRPGVTIEIDHPPGAETQWDWLEFPDTPWGEPANLLVGALSHSGKCRGVFCEAQDTAHLIEGVDGIVRRLGGVSRRWRIDHMSGAVVPATDRLVPAFADAAKHYGAGVDVCASRRAKRKGVVESANDYLTQSWWRTASVSDPIEAQASLDRFCTHVADHRPRGDVTVAELATAEALRPAPRLPYPAMIEVRRSVTWSSLVSFEGNRYSVPPAFVSGHVMVRARLGSDTLEITSLSGEIVARHRRHTPGSRALERMPEHRQALEAAVLDAFSTSPPCRRKANRPPSAAARALAEKVSPSGALQGSQMTSAGSGQRDATRANAPVVSLERYAELVQP
ncbi:MAG: Mu transposase domain-containing protein [Thermoleophilaceae bacterium]